MKHYSLDEGLLWFATRRSLRRLYVPVSRRTKALRKSHDHELSAHGGTRNTVERVSRSFWWPTMRPAAAEYALSCRGDATGVSRVPEPGVSGCRVEVVVLGRW